MNPSPVSIDGNFHANEVRTYSQMRPYAAVLSAREPRSRVRVRPDAGCVNFFEHCSVPVWAVSSNSGYLLADLPADFVRVDSGTASLPVSGQVKSSLAVSHRSGELTTPDIWRVLFLVTSIENRNFIEPTKRLE